MAQSSMTIGRVTADLNLKISERGNPYLRFSIAEKVGFGKFEKTQYSQVWARGSDAENLVNANVKRGSLIWVSGPIEIEEFQKADGKKDKQLKIELIKWGFISFGNYISFNHSIYKNEVTETKAFTDMEKVIDGDRDKLPE